ncbi:MAG: hypothetical protein ABSA96_08590 [Candidatus Acidiferrales bacterium]
MMTNDRKFQVRRIVGTVSWGACFLFLGSLGFARAAQSQVRQPPASQAGSARPSAKASALIDITGYWVAIVNEDWVYRMMTPAKGDRSFVPLNAAGQQVADAWDPAKDQAEGNECKAYGAGNIMRIPERLHITWVDDNTLQIETDAGMQKRLFHFDGSKWQGGDPELQGYSVASFEKQPQLRAGGAVHGPAAGTGGSLHVVTTHMRPGYLQKNGIPYSGDAVLTEFYHLIDLHGTGFLILTSMVNDPTYLREPYVLSSQFKREPDGSKWDPSPCRPLWPLSLRALTQNRRPGGGPAE